MSCSKQTPGKRLLAALTIILLVFLAINGQQPQQSGRKAPRSAPNPADKRPQECKANEHDTPPPITITTGSLLIDVKTAKADWGNFTTVGARRTISIPATDLCGNPPNSDIYIAHVKVVDGSGDLLFRLANDKNKSNQVPVSIALSITGQAGEENLNLTLNGQREFLLDFPLDRRVMPFATEPLQNGRRRLRYMDDNGTTDFVLAKVEVRKGSQFLYHVTLDELPSRGSELIVMIWWEELRRRA